MPSSLVVFAGVPGVGKSSVADGVARALGRPVLSVDPIEQGMADAGIPPSFERGLAAYLVAARCAAHLLGLGQGVIVDAVNAEPEGRAVWHELGEAAGIAPTWVHVTCSDPAVHRARLEGRARRYADVDEPTWAAVTARAAGFAPWTDERITVDTASPLPTTIAHVLAALS